MDALLNRPLAALMAEAASLRDAGHGRLFSYSRKVFIPLTRLCRDVCHYCTFAEKPRPGRNPYLTPEEVLASPAPAPRPAAPRRSSPSRQAGAALAGGARGAGCARPRQHHRLSRRHVRPGAAGNRAAAACQSRVMTREEIAALREVTASQGIMLEATSARLSAPGGVHHGSPDKDPALRLGVLRMAGELRVPFTTGILIGIGETRAERVEALQAIAALQAEHGHIQEVIIQNFRAKPGTKLAGAAEPDLDDLLWTIAVARILLGPAMNIQAPPNLSPGIYQRLVAAGLNDWGGVSPVTIDHVNPESPWPEIAALAARTAEAGKVLVQRLPAYPTYVRAAEQWISPAVAPRLRQASDAEGWAREDRWSPGELTPPVLPCPAPRHGRCRTGARCRAGRRRREARPRRHHAPVRRARCRFRPCRAGGRCAAPHGLRRDGALCRQPQHQLHEYLHLSLQLLRLQQGPHA
jgi:FO synthase